MITCPNCRSQEIEGSLFCSECGARLVDVTGMPTHSIRQTGTTRLKGAVAQQVAVQPPPANAVIALHLLEFGQILPLTGKKEFTIGRSTEGQPIVPDVDLATYQAYEKGISRMHASLKADGKSVSIMDLKSINGTRLNGMKLAPYEAQALKHGDLLILGSMKIQILIP